MDAAVVVDADDWVRAAMASCLRREGFSVVEASDGRTGATACATAGTRAVVIELDLPDMSGVELCRDVRAALGPDPVILLVAGFGSAADVAGGRDAGSDGFLVKPFDCSTLARAIRAARANRGQPPQA